MKMTMKITAGVLMACAMTAGADTVRNPKALVIMLDGMRADSIENVYTPNLRMLRDGYLYRIAFNAKDIKFKTGLPFFLGQDGTGKYPVAFNGDIDDFALWTRSLSYDDVHKIYEAGRNGIPLGDLLKVCD